jgi:hypothetical protein
MRIGIEIEGKYHGLNTLFVDVTELDRFHKNLDRYYEENRDIAQVYIDYPEKLNDQRLADISEKWFLTVETDRIKEPIPDYINHIMYSIRDEDIIALRKDDSFKVVTSAKEVYSIGVENVYRTHEEDFNGVDTEIEVYD